jgi:pilus assembly protein CpaE
MLNQVGMAKRPEIAPEAFCDPLEIEPLAIIPFDAPLFGEAANSGLMIAESSAKSPVPNRSRRSPMSSPAGPR